MFSGYWPEKPRWATTSGISGNARVSTGEGHEQDYQLLGTVSMVISEWYRAEQTFLSAKTKKRKTRVELKYCQGICRTFDGFTRRSPACDDLPSNKISSQSIFAVGIISTLLCPNTCRLIDNFMCCEWISSAIRNAISQSRVARKKGQCMCG